MELVFFLLRRREGRVRMKGRKLSSNHLSGKGLVFHGPFRLQGGQRVTFSITILN